VIGQLAAALETLLKAALPGLLVDASHGASPVIALGVSSVSFDLDPKSADAAASEPRPDDRMDTFPFDPAQPAGPYTLTQPPYPGPRRVRLVTAAGERLALQDGEVSWDEVEARRFTLQPRAARQLTGFSSVQVLYGVTAIFTILKATQTLNIQLKSSTRLDDAEALVIAVIELNRQQLIDQSRATYSDGDYGAAVDLKHLTLSKGASPAADTRLLMLQADVELKATRALRADEGKPITHILTPGQSFDPQHPIDIRIEVDA
jgi:hypothetical protein